MTKIPPPVTPGLPDRELNMFPVDLSKRSAGPKLLAKLPPRERKAAAMMCLVTGQRHMLVQDIPAAVSSMGEACEILC